MTPSPPSGGIEVVDNDKTLNEAGTVGLTTYMSGSAGPETVTLAVDKVTISSADALELCAHAGRAGKDSGSSRPAPFRYVLYPRPRRPRGGHSPTCHTEATRCVPRIAL